MGAALAQPRPTHDEVVALVQATAHTKPKKKRHKWKKPTTYRTRECLARDYLRAFTGMPDSWCSIRPKWLPGESRGDRKARNLEIDCWCPRLSTAVEVQGRYHTEHIWGTAEDHEATRRRDLLKARRLAELDVCLITVPSRAVVGDHEIARYILGKLAEHAVLGRPPFRLPVL